jgi:hypothetical protein
MAFVELKSTRPKTTISYTGDKVKLNFPIIRGKVCMMLHIGKDIVNQLGYKHQDKIRIFIDDQDNNLWWIKKDEKNESGWALIDVYHNAKTMNKLYKLQKTWNHEIPELFKNNKKLFLTWKIHQGGLMLTLPPSKSEEYTD